MHPPLCSFFLPVVIARSRPPQKKSNNTGLNTVKSCSISFVEAGRCYLTICKPVGQGCLRVVLPKLDRDSAIIKEVSALFPYLRDLKYHFFLALHIKILLRL